MSNYRRSHKTGATWFFTIVTYQRQAFLTHPSIHPLLREAVQKTRQNHPFTIDAWVLLPDHMHCIWTLPDDDKDFSKRWNQLKGTFSRLAKPHLNEWLPLKASSNSRLKRRESNIWQRRFWEHQIRDDRDFQHHCDYIHYNPVKHGLVDSPKDWSFSTFQRYVQRGEYPENWGDSFQSKALGYGE